MKLLEGDLNKYIFTVANVRCVDLKPLHSLLLPVEFVFANDVLTHEQSRLQQQGCSKKNT